MDDARARLETVVGAFETGGRFMAGERHGAGHIHDTYAVTVERAGARNRYILQRLNTAVFTNPRGLMANVRHVTGHLHAKLRADGIADAERRALSLLRTRDGHDYLEDPKLGVWRAYGFIERARVFDAPDHTGRAFQAARAFGTFQRLLQDYEGPRLLEILPGFHDTRARLGALQVAVAADPAGRAREAARDIDFALGRGALAGILEDLKASGALPERITHNDTKLNNVMFDEETGEGLCVLDLDTVMPGLSLYDFGDLVRSACNPVAEDETDLGKVVARGDIFEALAGGYLSATEDLLLPVERAHLALAGQVLALECGLRFLTDHLQGDGYFRIHRPSQNLDRARNQFALLRSLEAQADDFMRRVSGL